MSAPRVVVVSPADAVSFISQSRSRKLSPVEWQETSGRDRPIACAPFVSSTYVAIAATCPRGCPFYKKACYIDAGPTKKLSATLDAAAKGFTADEIIAAEGRLLQRAFRGGPIPDNGLGGRRHCRLHVGGDCPTAFGARELAVAADDWVRREGGVLWTYTHWWRRVPREAWGKISVLASVERPEDIERARERGYAAAITVPSFPTGAQPFALEGTSAEVIPCPAETRGRTCITCGLCLNDRKLLRIGKAIGFALHGPGAAAGLVSLRRSKDGGALRGAGT